MGQRGRVVGGAEGGVEIGGEGVAVLGFVFDQLQIAHDDGEKIIEVMGDAAGQLTHGLHLYGLIELGLDSFHLGNICRKAAGAHDETLIVPEGKLRVEHITD